MITALLDAHTRCLEAKTINNQLGSGVGLMGAVMEGSQKMTPSDMNFERDMSGCKIRNSQWKIVQRLWCTSTRACSMFEKGCWNSLVLTKKENNLSIETTEGNKVPFIKCLVCPKVFQILSYRQWGLWKGLMLGIVFLEDIKFDINYHKLSSFQQHTLIISQFPWVRSPARVDLGSPIQSPTKLQGKYQLGYVFFWILN